MPSIDLNGDLGESFGRWLLADDPVLLGALTSVNLACGFHAGDPSHIRAAAHAAAAHQLAIGAHPSFYDLRGFGRTPMALPPDVVRDDVIYQLGALQALCRAEGATLRHVKPHGALYHTVAGDPDVATAVAEAIAAVDPGLPLVLPFGASTASVVEDIGLTVVYEAFLDRGYAPDGRLLPRGRAGAVLDDPAEAAERDVPVVAGGDGDPGGAARSPRGGRPHAGRPGAARLGGRHRGLRAEHERD
ncbi:MAG: LamB/YcsF family protein, partial [Trueperaceae bacterium]|nr:LamB/YcsF family protein [Trueperaceae bacterium]